MSCSLRIQRQPGELTAIIYGYTDTDREISTQTGRQTETQACRQTGNNTVGSRTNRKTGIRTETHMNIPGHSHTHMESHTKGTDPAQASEPVCCTAACCSPFYKNSLPVKDLPIRQLHIIYFGGPHEPLAGQRGHPGVQLCCNLGHWSGEHGLHGAPWEPKCNSVPKNQSCIQM